MHGELIMLLCNNVITYRSINNRAVLVGAAWLFASIDREDQAEMLVSEALEREPDGLEPLFLRAVLRGGRLREAGDAVDAASPSLNSSQPPPHASKASDAGAREA